MHKEETNFSLKDLLFNKQKVEYLASLIKNVYTKFQDKDFEKDCLDKFRELELKQRISHISNILEKYLPKSYEKSLEIIINSLPDLKENWKLDDNFWDFIFAPFWEFIARNWCNKKYLEISLDALEKLTSRFSWEDAIRYFLNSYEKETFEEILIWSKSDNYHVRRLASEWTRPKLPWCQKINLDYKKTIKILDNLYTDKSRYVTRSVANHLNDIWKIDSKLVISTLEKWKKENISSDLDYIISHSTRNLVKLWDKNTLIFLWYSPNPKINFKGLEIKNKNISIWEKLEFEIKINSKGKQNLIIDYRLYFPNKIWKYLTKVFKIKKWEFIWDLTISKFHKFDLMTTRKLFEWEHFIEIIINWKIFKKESFDLKIESAEIFL